MSKWVSSSWTSLTKPILNKGYTATHLLAKVSHQIEISQARYRSYTTHNSQSEPSTSGHQCEGFLLLFRHRSEVLGLRKGKDHGMSKLMVWGPGQSLNHHRVICPHTCSFWTWTTMVSHPEILSPDLKQQIGNTNWSICSCQRKQNDQQGTYKISFHSQLSLWCSGRTSVEPEGCSNIQTAWIASASKMTRQSLTKRNYSSHEQLVT